jgi:hypothetical protein
LIDDYPAEVAADFRQQFNLSIFDIGDKYSFEEALYLMTALLKDPGTWLFAAKAEWEYPQSRLLTAIKDTWDLQVAINTPKGKKQIKYPQPFKNTKTQSTNIAKSSLPVSRAKEVLAFMNSAKTKKKLTLEKD